MKETLITFILLRLTFPRLKTSKNYHPGISISSMNTLMVNLFLSSLDLNYNTQKKYQNFYYSTKPMKSTFRMSLQNDKKGRSFFEPMRE